MYFNLGIDHILNIDAYDHILFLATLVSIYSFKKWKELIIIVSSFTIGHTISLFLGTFKIINVPSKYVELFVILTILFTAVWNIVKINFLNNFNKMKFYLPSLLFGMIHGLGFSYTLQQLLFVEKEIFIALLAFNVGVEIGQLIVIPVFLILNTLLHWCFNRITVIVSSLNLIIIFVSIYLIFIRWPA
ncbi:MAG: HupE/UreJ family protein [Bacteroidales bacterium]|nr:HupE/UreJ family protein [Bacteroidales bacterium]